MAPETDTRVALKIDREHASRADAIKVALEKTHPDMRFTRSDVVRMALTRGFDKLVEEMHDPNEAL